MSNRIGAQIQNSDEVSFPDGVSAEGDRLPETGSAPVKWLLEHRRFQSHA